MTIAIRVIGLGRTMLGVIAFVSWCSLAHAQVASTQPVCLVAAAGCFEGCGPGMVRTRAGACVPFEVTEAPPAYHPLSGKMAGAEGAAPVNGTSVDALPCCYTELRVDLTGWRNLGPTAETTSVSWQLKLNGRRVGTTPFVDGLPAGKYAVEVTGPSGHPYATLVDLPGSGVLHVSGSVPLALDQNEARARSAWQRERVAKANAEIERVYDARLATWHGENAPRMSERSTRYLWAAVSGGSALLLLGTGVGLVAAAGEADDDAVRLKTEWALETERMRREELASEVDRLQTKRDVFTGVGLGSVALGAGAAVTAVVLLLGLPTVSERPPAPVLYAGDTQLELAPGYGSLSARLRL